MKALPLGVKLTAWYFAVLCMTLCAFGVIAFFALRTSIDTTVDEQLRDQIDDAQGLMERAQVGGEEALADELREHSELQPGGGWLQVSDGAGRWIFRSPAMTRFEVQPSATLDGRVTARQSKGMPLRVLTAKVGISGQTYQVQVAAPMDDFSEAIERFTWELFILIPLLLVLACAAGYWMSRRALSPVDQITRTARTISAGNLSSRLDVPQTRDELQRLSETLNQMLERLESAFKRITQFTADASHELRTPVTFVRTTAEVSLLKQRSDADYRKALQQILEESEQTSILIDKLMLLARADAGVETLRLVPANVAETLREACNHGRTLAEAARIGFRQDISCGDVIVQGDIHLLQRLFLILMDNAAKYTPPQGQITVSLTASDGLAVVEINDTGIGISEKDLPHIFERFYRADPVRSRESGGTGLGLSIARWIVDAHQGSMEVYSKPAVGSTFRVRLPLMKTNRH